MVKPTEETDALCQDLVRRLVPAVSPSRIILFGSQAEGRATPDSDLDVLLVVDRPNPRKVTAEAHRSLWGFPAPVDVVVYRPEDFETYRKDPTSFLQEVIRTGRTIYEAG